MPSNEPAIRTRTLSSLPPLALLGGRGDDGVGVAPGGRRQHPMLEVIRAAAALRGRLERGDVAGEHGDGRPCSSWGEHIGRSVERVELTHRDRLVALDPTGGAVRALAVVAAERVVEREHVEGVGGGAVLAGRLARRFAGLGGVGVGDAGRLAAGAAHDAVASAAAAAGEQQSEGDEHATTPKKGHHERSSRGEQAIEVRGPEAAARARKLARSRSGPAATATSRELDRARGPRGRGAVGCGNVRRR